MVEDEDRLAPGVAVVGGEAGVDVAHVGFAGDARAETHNQAAMWRRSSGSDVSFSTMEAMITAAAMVW